MIKKISLLLLFFCSLGHTSAQEINCEVSVEVSQDLSQSSKDKDVYQKLEDAMRKFLNETSWVNDKFKIEERIDCNFVLTLKSKNGNTYSGQLQVQSTRPVFKSSYNTVLFNYLDENISFKYTRNTQLLFNIQSHQNNLTSLMAYYAYMIIGYDYDSFKKEGGTPMFSKAQQIVSNAQSSGGTGWVSSGYNAKNRFQLITNVLNGSFQPLRTCFYKYHRLGFDKMVADLESARKTVLEALKELKKINRNNPNSMNVSIFLQAKQRELINLFSQSTQKEKNEAVNLLKSLDPSNSSKYQKINSTR